MNWSTVYNPSAAVKMGMKCRFFVCRVSKCFAEEKSLIMWKCSPDPLCESYCLCWRHCTEHNCSKQLPSSFQAFCQGYFINNSLLRNQFPALFIPGPGQQPHRCIFVESFPSFHEGACPRSFYIMWIFGKTCRGFRAANRSLIDCEQNSRSRQEKL